MTVPLRVAVIGCGVGKVHIRSYQALSERFEVEAVCDRDEAKARQTAALYHIPRWYADFDDVCELSGLDVIDICTPPGEHFAQIRQALAAGKHVICEKPLVGSLSQVDELAVAEEQSGRRLMPIFQYRFGGGIQKLRFLRDEGIAGRAYVATVEVAWRRRTEYYAVPWRGKWATELGGTLMAHAIHALDMLCFILGPARSAFARTATLVHPIEVEDCASASLEMADGSLVSLSATVGSTVEITRHRFCFSNLTAESNTRPYESGNDPWNFTGDTPEIEREIAAALARFTPQPDGFEGQFSRFYSALASDGILPVTLEDVRTVLELITAMYHSSQTARPVGLPLSPDHAKYRGWAP